MKTYDTNLRNEFYRDRFICIDLLDLYLTDAEGDADYLFLCGGGFDIVQGGNTYTAQGDFIGYSTVSEEFDVKVGKFSIYLSALGSGMINRFVDKDVEGKRVRIRKAFLDITSTSMAIINTPIIVFDGQIYNVSVVETENSASITIDCSTLFADFERTAGRRTTNGSNWLFQGSTVDTAFEKSGFVGQTEFLWGRLN
jgi:hypothetical protein